MAREGFAEQVTIEQRPEGDGGTLHVGTWRRSGLGVTESCGVWLLTAQKPESGQVGEKESFLYFRCQQLEEGHGESRYLSKDQLPLALTVNGKELL